VNGLESGTNSTEGTRLIWANAMLMLSSSIAQMVSDKMVAALRSQRRRCRCNNRWKEEEAGLVTVNFTCEPMSEDLAAFVAGLGSNAP
jgi:hypothetical protein